MLRRAFHKDDLHQLVQQTGRVVKVFQQLFLYHVEVTFRQLVQQDTNLTHVATEFVNLRDRSLSELRFPFFMREVQQSHVNRSQLIFGSQAYHKLSTVNFVVFSLFIFELRLETCFLNLRRVEMAILVATKVII